MNFGFIKGVIDDMEKGTYNFCVNGKCSECGECCSSLLPLSQREIDDIKRYVKKKHIKPCNHCAGNSHIQVMDLVCPFCDTSKENHKCRIYDVRPMICREFKCDMPPSKARMNKEQFGENRMLINLWSLVREREDDM